MDFSLSPPLLALRDKTRQFIAEQVIPLENDERQSSHGPSDALRRELVGRARDAGLRRITLPGEAAAGELVTCRCRVPPRRAAHPC